jgi:hypothetical protein
VFAVGLFIIDLENNKLIIIKDNKKIDSNEYGEFTYGDTTVFIKYEQIDINDKQLKERVLKIINTYGEQNEPKGNDNGRPI